MHHRQTSDERRQEMFAAYCQNPALDYVAKRCKVHIQTAKKYCRLDRWDQRLDEIRRKAQRQQDYDIAKEYKRTLKLIGKAKSIYELALTRFKAGNIEKFRIGLTDIKDLANTEMLLTGKPTERVEISLEQLQKRRAERIQKKKKVNNDKQKAPPKAKRGNAITGKNGRHRLRRPRRSSRVPR